MTLQCALSSLRKTPCADRLQQAVQRPVPVHRPQRSTAADAGRVRPAAARLCGGTAGLRQRRPVAAHRRRCAGEPADRSAPQAAQDLLGAGGRHTHGRAARRAAPWRGAERWTHASGAGGNAGSGAGAVATRSAGPFPQDGAGCVVVDDNHRRPQPPGPAHDGRRGPAYVAACTHGDGRCPPGRPGARRMAPALPRAPAAISFRQTAACCAACAACRSCAQWTCGWCH